MTRKEDVSHRTALVMHEIAGNREALAAFDQQLLEGIQANAEFPFSGLVDGAIGALGAAARTVSRRESGLEVPLEDPENYEDLDSGYAHVFSFGSVGIGLVSRGVTTVYVALAKMGPDVVFSRDQVQGPLARMTNFMVGVANLDPLGGNQTREILGSSDYDHPVMSREDYINLGINPSDSKTKPYGEHVLQPTGVGQHDLRVNVSMAETSGRSACPASGIPNIEGDDSLRAAMSRLPMAALAHIIPGRLNIEEPSGS